MSVYVALMAGLVFWVVAWAFGAKAIDAFMVPLALVLIAVTARLVGPFVREYLRP
jgi:hypothetical protein